MSGKSGKIAGRDNANVFEDFIAACNKEDGWHEYVLPGGRDLNKTAISKSCGFARSVFVQNPAIKLRFARLLDELGLKGTLKGDIDDALLLSRTGLTRDDAVQELTDKLAKLENEVTDLRRLLDESDEKAAYYEVEAKILSKGRSAGGPWNWKGGARNGKSEKRTATE